MGRAGGDAVRAAADWHTISLPAGQVHAAMPMG